jgi:hypothetical protein
MRDPPLIFSEGRVGRSLDLWDKVVALGFFSSAEFRTDQVEGNYCKARYEAYVVRHPY